MIEQHLCIKGDTFSCRFVLQNLALLNTETFSSEVRATNFLKFSHAAFADCLLLIDGLEQVCARQFPGGAKIATCV